MGPPKVSYVWCFTFQYAPEAWGNDAGLPLSEIEQSGLATKCRYQLEKAPSTGKLHLQGVIRLVKLSTFTAAKAAFEKMRLGGAHIEMARGTFASNLAYCSKADTRVSGPYDFGDMSDPESVDRQNAAAQQPLNQSDLIEAAGHLPPNWRFITVCWGPPAIGKTRLWTLIGEYVGGGIYFVPGKAKNSESRTLPPGSTGVTALRLASVRKLTKSPRSVPR